jgi:preprotein translocase subunit YajC
MSLHPGMKVLTSTGKKATVVEVGGNEIKLKTKKSSYWINKYSIKRTIKNVKKK